MSDSANRLLALERSQPLFHVQEDDFHLKSKEDPPLDSKWLEVEQHFFGKYDYETKVTEFRTKLQETRPDLLKHIPEPADLFLLRVLRGGELGVDKSTAMLAKYVQIMRDGSTYFQLAFEPMKKIEAVLQDRFHTVLKHRDKFGRRVLIGRAGMWDPYVHSFSDALSVAYSLSEMVACEEKTQIAGCTLIVDGTNFGFKQLRSFSLEGFRYAATLLQVFQLKKLTY